MKASIKTTLQKALDYFEQAEPPDDPQEATREADALAEAQDWLDRQ